MRPDCYKAVGSMDSRGLATRSERRVTSHTRNEVGEAII